jgi:hypothetical protein
MDVVGGAGEKAWIWGQGRPFEEDVQGADRQQARLEGEVGVQVSGRRKPWDAISTMQRLADDAD